MTGLINIRRKIYRQLAPFCQLVVDAVQEAKKLLKYGERVVLFATVEGNALSQIAKHAVALVRVVYMTAQRRLVRLCVFAKLVTFAFARQSMYVEVCDSVRCVAGSLAAGL